MDQNESQSEEQWNQTGQHPGPKVQGVNTSISRPAERVETQAECEAERGDSDAPTQSALAVVAGVELTEQYAFLHQQIERLPESYRLLVTLRFQQELSYEEIARIVNLPLGTVKTGIFRARQLLRAAWHAYEGEQETSDG